MEPAVIYDDHDPAFLFQYIGSNWVSQPSNSAFGGTLTVLDTQAKNITRPQTLNASFFYASAIVIYGTLTNSIAMGYAFDTNEVLPTTINFTDTGSNSKIGVKILGLQGGPEKISNNLTVFPSSGTFNIDFVTSTPNKFTDITNRNIIYDDTHRTAISAYGSLNQAGGRLSASFAIDQNPATNLTFFDGTQTVDSSSWRLYQRLWNGTADSGNHTLAVTLTEVSGSQMLYIDSLIYQSSLSHINETIISSLPHTSTAAPTTSASASTSSHHLSAGATGGIISSITVVAGGLIILALCFRSKHRKAVNRQRWPPEVLNGYRDTHTPAIPMKRVSMPIPRSPQQYPDAPLPSFFPSDTHASAVPTSTPVPTSVAIHEVDAGPVVLPPPYDDSLYVQ
ncbi:hypothetical protein GALMADRAFT_136884 [Galerina marginata CBS 339.88]|uniref:Transmembrane protein n=1 Tax=Galerina marginata (strain CBS 339.88) TaxID=685588 RepID=A0A067TN65_GALM3|nr:hypothetical protein GALMADRAFT_136884 [Galerina marginata CBS 339.88]